MIFTFFCRLFFSSKKTSLIPPSGFSRKVNPVKTMFLLFEHLLFWVLLSSHSFRTSFPLLKQLFYEIHFLTEPWGGLGAFFSMKKKVDRKTLKSHKSTQFWMLIQNIILVSIQIVLYLIEIYQKSVKND